MIEMDAEKINTVLTKAIVNMQGREIEDLADMDEGWDREKPKGVKTEALKSDIPVLQVVSHEIVGSVFSKNSKSKQEWYVYVASSQGGGKAGPFKSEAEARTQAKTMASKAGGKLLGKVEMDQQKALDRFSKLSNKMFKMSFKSSKEYERYIDDLAG